jgi:hypothetical protein
MVADSIFAIMSQSDKFFGVDTCKGKQMAIDMSGRWRRLKRLVKTICAILDPARQLPAYRYDGFI